MTYVHKTAFSHNDILRQTFSKHMSSREPANELAVYVCANVTLRKAVSALAKMPAEKSATYLIAWLYQNSSYYTAFSSSMNAVEVESCDQ